MATKTLADRAEVLAPLGIRPLLNQAQLEAYYDVSNWTVNEWIKRGCPTEPVGIRGRRFDLVRVAAWMAEDSAKAA